jgi:hypothetical protein
LIEVLVVSKAGHKFHKSAQRKSFEQELTEIPKKVVLVPFFEIFATSLLKNLS